jgi:hypothetical protein
LSSPNRVSLNRCQRFEVSKAEDTFCQKMKA